jgi:hypothetical protein
MVRATLAVKAQNGQAARADLIFSHKGERVFSGQREKEKRI